MGKPWMEGHPEGWHQLLEHGVRRGGEARFLSSLIETVQRATGAHSLALYSTTDGAARRCAGGGCGGSLPVGFELEPEPAGWVDLSNGLGLLFEPADAAPRLSAPSAAAIVSAFHAASLSAQLKKQRFEVAQQGVQLEALYDVGLAIASTLDAAELGDEILLRAVSLLDARRGALYLASPGGFALAQTLGGDAVSVLADAEGDALAGAGAETAARSVEVLPGSEHILTVPIEVDGVRRGLLVVGDKESRRGVGPFESADGRTLGLFANQAGIALENADLHRQALEKKRLESELELAAEIQRRLLPDTFPELQGFEVAGWNRSARHVGGDYYDLIETESGLTLLLADVSGKGMPAALLVSTLHSAFRLLMAGRPVTAELIERLNTHIFESSAPNKFITLFAAHLDLGSGSIRYVSAGHNPAIRVTTEGSVDLLRSHGLPIGMLAHAACVDAETVLAPGDLLCIYSDGLTECENRAGEELGEQRLAELVAANRSESLAELINRLDRATVQFADGMPQADDETLLLLRRLP